MMTKVLASAGLVTVLGCGLWADETAKAPEFEAVSIKPADMPSMAAAMAGGGGRMMVRVGCTGGPGSTDPGRLVCNGVNARMLIMRAYNLKTYQITGPGFVDSERYDITAKIPEGTTRDQFSLMLQKVLTDRFHMTFHKESKELPVWAITVAKGGHKLKPAKEGETNKAMDDIAAGKPPSPPPSGGGGAQTSFVMMRTGGGNNTGLMMTMRNGLSEVVGTKASISNLADLLANQLSRPVVDETGLTGEWSFTMDYAPDDSMMNGKGMMVLGGAGMPAPPSAAADTSEPSGAPSIFSAMQNQLGLKLENKKSPVDTLVVDKIEKTPTEN